MLSEIIVRQRAEHLQVQSFRLPTPEELAAGLELRRQQQQRRDLVAAHPQAPVEAARQEAERILRETQERYQKSEREALILRNRREEELRRNLEQELRYRVAQETRQQREQFLQSLEGLEQWRRKAYQKLEGHLISLVSGVCEKILQPDRVDPDQIVHLLRQGFDALNGMERYVVHLHPEDHRILMDRKGALKEIQPPQSDVRYQADPQMAPGTLRVVTEGGELEADPRQMLRLLLEAMDNGEG